MDLIGELIACLLSPLYKFGELSGTRDDISIFNIMTLVVSSSSSKLTTSLRHALVH